MKSAIKPQGCTNFKLRQLMRQVARHYDAELAVSGLKTTQYSLLSHALGLGPLRPGELARAMGLSASTLTRNLQPMVEAGWLSLEAGADARSRTVQITEAGRAKRTEAQEHWRDAQGKPQRAAGRRHRAGPAHTDRPKLGAAARYELHCRRRP